MIVIETPRLHLRTWQASDFEPMLAINQDPNVMEFFPRLQNATITRSLLQTIQQHQDDYGFSLYACENRSDGQFIGFIGLITVDFKAHFTPAVEIGWRLAAQYWGQGLAPEGARAVLAHAFGPLALPEVVSMTACQNHRSIRVMQKIGLHTKPSDDFDHPKLEPTSPLKRHVLYRLTQAEFLVKTQEQ